MKTICLYFEIHQNIHLKRYRFFDIGTDHYYYDDYENERIINDLAERSYMPALNALRISSIGISVSFDNSDIVGLLSSFLESDSFALCNFRYCSLKLRLTLTAPLSLRYFFISPAITGTA